VTARMATRADRACPAGGVDRPAGWGVQTAKGMQYRKLPDAPENLPEDDKVQFEPSNW